MSIVELVDGFVPAVTEVNGVAELERLLSYWMDASDEPTVGDPGNFGGSPVIRVSVGADRFVLNRDTTRSAVRVLLTTAARVGGARQLPWQMVANRNGNVNYVSYLPDGAQRPGWYAYLHPDADRPRPLG